MKRRVAVLCGVLLSTSLVGCAPRFNVQQSTGQNYQVVPRGGLSKLAVHIVPAATLISETPDTDYVSFEDCQDNVIRVSDVRVLGIEKADETCKMADKNEVEATHGLRLAGAVVAVPIVLVVWALIKTLSKVDANH